METQLPASTETKSLATMKQAFDDVGITTSDLVIPKLLLMQNTSEYVGDDKAVMGDIVNSQTLEVIGGLSKPIELIPLKMYKTWRIYDVSGSQPKFLRQDAFTAANENQEWDGVEAGTPVRRDICMNFFVLLRSEIASGEAFPCVVTFRRTSMQAGKQLATHLFKMTMLGRAPYSKSVQLAVKKEKKDTNTYAVLQILGGENLGEAEVAAAKQWLGVLATTSYTVQEADETTSQEAAPAPHVVASAGPDLF